jgi:hypothetical protein
MTDLLSIGMSGFRVDAAKHVKPEDLAAIFGQLATNMGGSLPDDFIAYLEVRTTPLRVAGLVELSSGLASWDIRASLYRWSVPLFSNLTSVVRC